MDVFDISLQHQQSVPLIPHLLTPFSQMLDLRALLHLSLALLTHACLRSGGTVSFPDSGIKKEPPKKKEKRKENMPESVCGFYPGQPK